MRGDGSICYVDRSSTANGTLRIIDNTDSKRSTGFTNLILYLLAEDLFAFAFRFKTLSCRALIPSVGVMALAEARAPDTGLSGSWDSNGIANLSGLGPALILPSRLPFNFGSSRFREIASGVARSSTLIKSSKGRQKPK